MSEENTAPNADDIRISYMKDLIETLGLTDQVGQADLNNPALFEAVLNRAKVLLTANRELKGQNQQLKQEFEDISAAQTDPSEKDRIITDFMNKMNTYRDSILKLSTGFQKQLAERNIDAETIDKLLNFKASQEKIFDLEEKLNTQRLSNTKARKELEDRSQSLELQLVQAKEKLEEQTRTIQELQKKVVEDRVASAGPTASQDELTQALTRNTELKQKLIELDQQTRNLQIQNQQLQEQLAKFAQIDETLQTKDQQLEELEAEIQQKIRQIENMKHDADRVGELDQKIKELTDKLQQKDQILQESGKTKTELESKIQILEKAKTGLENEINSLKDACSLKEQELDALKTTIKQDEHLAQDLEQLKQTEIALQTKLKDKEQLIVEYEQSLNQTRTDLQTSTNKVSELQDAISHKDERISSLENEIQIQKSENQKIRQDLSAATDGSNTAVAQLNNQLIEKDALIEELKNKIKTLEDSLAQMVKREDFERVRTELTQIEAELNAKEQEATAKIQEKQEQIAKLEADHQKLQDRLALLQKEMQRFPELEQALQEKSARIHTLEMQFEGYQQCQKENEMYKQQLQDNAAALVEATQQKEVLYDLIRKLKADAQGDKAVILRLENRIKDMQGKGMRENIEIDLLKKKVGDLESELRQQLMKATEAQVRYETIKDDYEKKKSEIDQLKSEREQLKQNIAQIKAEMTEKLQQAQDSGKFKEEISWLQKELEEANKMSDSMADDLAKLKTENLVLKKDKATLEEETVNLKRRIKLLRRNVTGDKPPAPAPK
jgi:chromosome segregation ATPase